MIGYHGTTRANYEHIKSGGVKPNIEGITWCCSDDLNLYLWCPDVLAEAGECGEEDKQDFAIRMAFENGQITCAMDENPQNEIVVIKFDFNSEDIEEDCSTENMNQARCVGNDIDYEKHIVGIYTANHNSRLDAMVLSSIIDNPNLNKWKLGDDMIEACEALRDVYLESLLEFDWEEESI